MLRRQLRSLLALTALIFACVAPVPLLHSLEPPERDGIQRLDWQPHPSGVEARFTLAASTASLVLYFESLGGNARIIVNERPLPYGSLAADGTPGRSTPLLLPIPAALLQPGVNRISVSTQASLAGNAFVGSGWIGAEALLSSHYAQRYFLRHTLLVSLIVTAFVLAGVSLSLWLRRPQERIYAWNALTSFTGAAYSVLPIAHASLLPPPPWTDALLMMLFLWFVVGAARLGLHLVTAPQPRTQRNIQIAVVVTSVIIVAMGLAMDGPQFRAAMPWIYAAIIGLGTYTTIWVFWYQYLTRWDRTSFWMLAGVMCICLLSLHDCAQLFGWIGPQQGAWLPYGSPLPMTVFTSILLGHFVRALAESESLNRELERRVAEREARIAENYRALQQGDRERAVSAERERLFGDLHDGLGGTLMATLSRLSNDGAADSPAAHGVQAALEDLRLTLASLDPDARALRSALAPLRERLANACADAGIEFSFEFEGIDDGFELPKSQTLHLLRILQEGGMNAIRHAGCRHLRIALAHRDRGRTSASLDLRIEDDGVGIDVVEAGRPGHYGLPSLRRRAQRLGARIEWLTPPAGTCVHLSIPLSAGEVGPAARSHQFM